MTVLVIIGILLVMLVSMLVSAWVLSKPEKLLTPDEVRHLNQQGRSELEKQKVMEWQALHQLGLIPCQHPSLNR